MLQGYCTLRRITLVIDDTPGFILAHKFWMGQNVDWTSGPHGLLGSFGRLFGTIC